MKLGKKTLNKNKIITFLTFIVLCFVTKLSLVSAADGVADLKQYLLGTGDLIRIQVYDEQDLYLETRVSDSGSISYPFLGELKVQGLSLANLEDLIISRLKGDYLINPKVSIDMMEYRQFYVNGEVANSGGFAYQPGLTIRKAISLAGGFKERASKDKIFVIHDDSKTGEPVKVTLDAVVKPGDIITVEQSFF
ncbi:MAG: protein involved in polysaccharide export with SLBB domain [Gammaproteobacteria bacterium]|jgi:protein involved in polysaccharide export with SLBB domain